MHCNLLLEVSLLPVNAASGDMQLSLLFLILDIPDADLSVAEVDAASTCLSLTPIPVVLLIVTVPLPAHQCESSSRPLLFRLWEAPLIVGVMQPSFSPSPPVHSFTVPAESLRVGRRATWFGRVV